MATRFVNKAARLADITNHPTAAGIGFYGGRFYGNFNGTVAPLDGYPSFGNVLLVDGDSGSDTDERLPYVTINGAGATGGGVKIVSDDTVGATKDAGGLVIQGCHFKNCKSSAAAATGGAIYWSTDGGAWYVSIYGNEFIDCRAGICMLGSGISVPRHVKIVGNRFGSSANTTVDADIYVAGSGIVGLFIFCK